MPRKRSETSSDGVRSVPISGLPPSLHRNDPFPDLVILYINSDEIENETRRIRKAVKAQIVELKRSMERFGNRIPILVRGKNGRGRHEVIDGHARLAAARLLGAQMIPCIVVDDLPDAEIRRLALSLNKIQEAGKWDKEGLVLELGDLVALEDDYEIPGFEVPEIEAILLGDEDDTSDLADDLSDPGLWDGPAVTRLGDQWILGENSLICGSARDPAVYDLLFKGGLADVIWADPPYNVKINGHVRGAGQGFAEFAEASGEMTPTEFIEFLVETLGLASSHLKPGGILFCCMDWRHRDEMSAALRTIGLEVLNICVWVKSNPGMGSFYRSQHEWVFVARKPGARHRNNVALGVHGRNRSNVWFYAGATGGKADGDDDFSVHPTVKPLRMVRDALLDVSLPGELVLDPFFGSGTTPLAAERTRRRCVGIEIDPAYVDLTIRRWQAMTGDRAIHAVTGLPFGESGDDGETEDAEDARDVAQAAIVGAHRPIPIPIPILRRSSDEQGRQERGRQAGWIRQSSGPWEVQAWPVREPERQEEGKGSCPLPCRGR